MKNTYFATVASLCFIVAAKAQFSSLPSANAIQQSRNSDASADLTGGRVMANIPVYTYQSGNLAVPISLSYTGNGVKVYQQSSWVGTNWNLNAGGVITRVVNSYPDEKASQRIFLSDLPPPSSFFASDYMPLENDTRDFRADLFSYSFPGYSGAFYFDSNFTPHLLSNNTELKIETSGSMSTTNTYTIIITTPDGIKYYFGGADASETSSTAVPVPKRGSWMTEVQQINVTALATTAFYLYKITGYNNDEILFDYDTGAAKNYVFFQSETAFAVQGSYVPICSVLGKSIILSNVYHGTVNNPKKLSRIYSAGTSLEVKFNSEDLLLPAVGNIPTPQYDDKILKSIQVYDTNITKNIRNIVLDYLQPNLGNTLKNRFFLQKVSFNNTDALTAVACESYRMEYNQPEMLPGRYSYNVDLLGYYNGQANTTLIAKDENIIIDGAFAALAVREPSLEYATKGALTRMYYPTGGYSKFEYEQPTVKTSTGNTIELQSYRNDISLTPNSITSTSFSFGAGSPTNANIIVPENESMQAHLTVDVASGTSHHLDKIIVTVTDMATSAVQTQYITLQSTVLNYVQDFTFSLLKDHSYTIELKQDPINPSGKNKLHVYASFYFKKTDYFPALGIRLKKETKVSDGQDIGITRYYYKQAKDIGTDNDDSAVVTYDPHLSEESYIIECSSQNYTVYNLYTDPFSAIFSESDNQVSYKYVTASYGGDYFEQGGLEKQFRVEKKNDSIYVFSGLPIKNYGSSNTNNRTFLNGALLRERSIKQSMLPGAFSLFIASEKIYNYTFTSNHNIENLVVVTRPKSFNSELFLGNPYPGNSDIVIGSYKNTSDRFDLTSVISKEFMTPYSVNVTAPDDGVITNTTNYEYSALRGLPAKISVRDSEDRTRITKLYYPVAADLSALSSTISSSDMAIYNYMQPLNIISTPFQVENYIKPDNGSEMLLSKNRSVYLYQGGKVLPYRQQSAKGNSSLIESPSYISAYNTLSKPIETTGADGVKKTVIYGYKDNRIVAELTNASSSNVSMAATTIKTHSDAINESNAVTTMPQLESDFALLRSGNPSAMITTYLFNPDGTLNSVTDPRGYKTSYEYDECKRKHLSRGADGNIIEKYQYQLKNN